MNTHRMCIHIIAVVLFSFLSFIATVPAAAPPLTCDDASTPCLLGEQLPFSIGERCTYLIKMNIFNMTVGKLDLYLKEITTIRGHECYHVTGDIIPTGAIVKSMNYYAHEYFDEYFDTTTFEVIRIVTIKTESTLTNKVRIDVYPEKKEFHYKDHQYDFTKKYEYKLLGMMTMIYAVRVVRLNDTDHIRCSLLNGYNVEPIDAIVSYEGKIRTIAFNERSDVITVRHNAFGEQAIWLLDDDRRIPVRMKTIPIEVYLFGKVNLYLWLVKYSQ